MDTKTAEPVPAATTADTTAAGTTAPVAADTAAAPAAATDTTTTTGEQITGTTGAHTAPAAGNNTTTTGVTTGTGEKMAAVQGTGEMKGEMDQWVTKVGATTRNHAAITNPTGTAPWNTGFFDCIEPLPLCFVTCCFPCITFGRTQHRLHKEADPSNFSILNASCLFWQAFACVGLHCIPNLMQRAEIRERANPPLAGNFATDCLKAWCCNCCDLMQQEKETKYLLIEKAAANTVSAQPGTQQGMTYAPQ